MTEAWSIGTIYRRDTALTVTFQLDDDLEQQLRRDLGDLGQAAHDALLTEAYRQGKLSIGRLARTLGIGVLEADEWLAQRGVPLNFTLEDLKADEHTLRELSEGADRWLDELVEGLPLLPPLPDNFSTPDIYADHD